MVVEGMRRAMEEEEKEKIARYNDHKTIRRILWWNHGCHINALYGDDGEMQCGRCFADFKRDSFKEIEERLKDWRKE